jgi:hypothetical protein
MNFQVTKKCENCIEIDFLPDADLTDAIIKILGKDRNLITKITNPTHHMEICVYTGAPMFVEAVNHHGTEVAYVKGSGDEYYEHITNNKN